LAALTLLRGQKSREKVTAAQALFESGGLSDSRCWNSPILLDFAIRAEPAVRTARLGRLGLFADQTSRPLEPAVTIATAESERVRLNIGGGKLGAALATMVVLLELAQRIGDGAFVVAALAQDHRNLWRKP
jgi:hypothetical protein